MPNTPSDAISGIGSRYELGEVLGQGGFGIVYRAYDRTRGLTVALKKLQRVSPHALYRFKTEFRAMADIAHPNLVRLYELRNDGEEWALAMELIEGQDLLRYVRPGGSYVATPTTFSTDSLDDAPAPPPPPAASAAFDEARLRGAFGQIARAIDALHTRGVLHRDLKPSNVRVTDQGRAVVLDFGLAIELEHGKQTGVIAGTPDYIAPEHAAGEAIAEPSDWYAFGVMLYEALTGRVPFSGPPMQVLQQKAFFRAPDPRVDLPQIPADLAQLAQRLLEPKPQDRPDSAQILAILAAGAAARSPRSSPLVGRESELASLGEALERVQREQAPTVVWVLGESGMGKTALVRHFMEESLQHRQVVALSGRCYEREALPYKGLDNLVDRVARWLSTSEQLAALTPRYAGALVQLFPVLGALDKGAWTRAPGDVQDPFERRRRASSSLRDLLGRVGERWDTVFFLDDVQWSDKDGAELLSELLVPPDAPPILWLLSCRAGDLDRSPIYQKLAAMPQIHQQTLRVQPLDASTAVALASALLAEGRHRDQAERIARECQGNPYFLDQLARLARGGTSAPEASLDALIRDRVEALPEPARRMLSAVAVAGRPIPSQIAARVAGGNPGESIDPLLVARLVRLGADTTEERIETWHDRIRETVVASQTPERLRELHLRLARELEGQGDPEAIAEHYRGAGMPDEAARRFAQAGDDAAAVLAFDRAARLYREALDGAAWGEERPKLLAKLGEALYTAGRLSEAAASFKEAASGAEGAFALAMRHAAAMSLLQGGHVVEGSAIIREVLGVVGLRLPGSAREALPALLWRRLLVRLGGGRFREKPTEKQSQALQFRADVCWSVAAGLVFVDSVRAALFQSEMLIVARKLGDPVRYTRALLFEIGFGAIGGGRARAHMRAAVARAEAFVGRLRDPQLDAALLLNTGVIHLFRGEWAEAVARYDRALELYRTRCSGVTWEKDSAILFTLRCQFYLGRVAEMVALTDQAVREAEGRGDRYLLNYAGLRNTPYCALVRDEAADLPERLDQHLASLKLGDFFYQHLQCLCSTVDAELYLGRGDRALARVQAAWPAIARSLMLRNQYSFIETWFTRGRAALAGGGDDVALCARKLRGERMPWADACAALLEAGLAIRDGSSAAIDKLEEAARGYEACEMALHAGAARRRIGQLRGDQSAVAAVEDWLRGQGVVNPGAFCRIVLAV